MEFMVNCSLSIYLAVAMAAGAEPLPCCCCCTMSYAMNGSTICIASQDEVFKLHRKELHVKLEDLQKMDVEIRKQKARIEEITGGNYFGETSSNLGFHTRHI